jgi:hypothetical protein
LTVIVVSFFESVFADHSKDHPMAVTYFSATRSPGSVHHSAGRHSAQADGNLDNREEGPLSGRCGARVARPGGPNEADHAPFGRRDIPHLRENRPDESAIHAHFVHSQDRSTESSQSIPVSSSIAEGGEH